MSSAERILTLFFRFQAGESFTEDELVEIYGVVGRTVRRDIEMINHFLESHSSLTGRIVTDPKTNKKKLTKASQFNKKEILVISKILLENRAFNTAENNALLSGLLALLSNSDQKEINGIIASERLNYAPLQDEQARIDKIWEFSEYIRLEQMIDFDYRSLRRPGLKKHTVLPVSLYYDKHYFYIKGFDLEKQAYLDFRMDGVDTWDTSDAKKPIIEHRNKYRDGDHRNYKVDAFSGDVITIRIFYTPHPNFILDEFPQARIIEKREDGHIVEIKSQNTFGLKRSLISHLDGLTVLSPACLVEDIKDTLTMMQKKYK